MLQRIGGKAAINLFDMLGKSGNESSWFPFSHPRRYFYFSARYAIAAGIQALGINAGDTVLLPSYNCGVEIYPFHHYGILTEFYRITKSLEPDFDDLSRRLKGGVKAVLATHFLGFPQPIEEMRDICTRSRAFLIEDCAHALLSSAGRAPLGSHGDIAVFSILKTLPVPNGGLLVINNEAVQWASEPPLPSGFSTAYYCAELLRQKTSPRNTRLAIFDSLAGMAVSTAMYVAKRCIGATNKFSGMGGLCLVRPDSFEFREEVVGWGMSKVSERVISSADLERIKETRRNNFRQYHTQFLTELPRGVALPITELPVGVCPLFFPLIIEGEGQREEIYLKLKKRGITTHPWWDWFHEDVPWQEFPEAVYLKQRLFGLPVHQDLEAWHIERVIKELRSVISER